MPEKALAPGTVIQDVKPSYKVVSLLRSDGQGYTYKTVVKTGTPGHEKEIFMVVREHMMARCSSRGEDGMTVVTPDDIAPTVASCREAFMQVSRERAKVAADCPWLIGVIETFEANDTYYYVAEFLDGVTLREYVQANGGRLTYEQARLWLSPVLDAVLTLHRNHVLHTDIHPGHIRFVKNGKGLSPVLFSLYSTLHFGDKGLQEWSLPAMNCEEGYAPPEQYGHIDHFYPQTDVYAVAATLVYALSGKSLPDSRTITEQAIRDTLPPALPESLMQALISALDPDLNRRTASISKFRDDLLEFRSSYYGAVTRRKSDDDSDSDDEQSHSPAIECARTMVKKVLGLFGATGKGK